MYVHQLRDQDFVGSVFLVFSGFLVNIGLLETGFFCLAASNQAVRQPDDVGTVLITRECD